MANKKDSSTKPELHDDSKFDADIKTDDPKPSFKIYVGIDFGTDGCGLAYALNDGTSYIHNLWKDVEPSQKPRTSVLFDNTGKVQCIGNQAAMQYINCMANDGWKLFERFKMSLFETPSWKTDIKSVSESVQKVDLFADQIQSSNDPKLFELSETVFVTQLSFLREQATAFMKQNFKRRKKMKYNVNTDIQWILTVPAIWSDKAKQQMKQWGIKAKLFDGNIPNQLKIVYEPDCASLSIQCALLNNIQSDEKEDANTSKSPLQPHKPHISLDTPFKIGDQYVLIDVGGGTCDIACHEIMGEFQIAEIMHPSGGPWGGRVVDKQFVKLLRNIFSSDDGQDWIAEFKDRDQQNATMYQQLLQNFIEMSKPTFYDYVAMGRNYHTVTIPHNFAYFLIDKFEDMDAEQQDETEGDETREGIDLINEFLAKRCALIWGKDDYISIKEINYGGYSLSIHNNVWCFLFDAIITPIIDHCKTILNTEEMNQCKYLFLVGGFANSKYFEHRMDETFGKTLSVVIPSLPQLCVVDGACRYGLKPDFMKIRRLCKTYGIQSNKLKSKVNVKLFPKGFIERKTYHNKQKNKYFVENCFNAFVRKNTAIHVDDKPIRKPIYKIKNSQKSIQIVIYSSNKEHPQTADALEIKRYNDDPEMGEDCQELAKLEIVFDKDNTTNKLWVEFSFSDTLLTVHTYPDKQEHKRRQIHIQYTKEPTHQHALLPGLTVSEVAAKEQEKDNHQCGTLPESIVGLNDHDDEDNENDAIHIDPSNITQSIDNVHDEKGNDVDLPVNDTICLQNELQNEIKDGLSNGIIEKSILSVKQLIQVAESWTKQFVFGNAANNITS
eukprot:357292_1